MNRNRIRFVFIVIIVLLSGYLIAGYITAPPAIQDADAVDVRVAAPQNHTIVVTSQGFVGTSERNVIAAISPNGRLLYINSTYRKYLDVDHVPGTRSTVIYVALDKRPCGTEFCYANVVERLNLTTGESSRVLTRYRQQSLPHDWHDVDVVDDERIAVADIGQNRLIIYNTTTGMEEWSWSAQQNYPISSGGTYSKDWTHLNDVEVLSDGVLMASLRNHDQVVFIDRRRGLIEDLTLGSDDEHSVLYEQHNPDYIPAERGGPAILVADSENDRVVEYQRDGDSWVRTWQWQDDRMQWPRDADRLPNGDTLITDSNTGRVLIVDPSGDVTWSVGVEHPYEAEALKTGDESIGGHSARQLNLTSRTASTERERTFEESVRLAIIRAVPQKLKSGILFILPSWVGFWHVLSLSVLFGIVGCWVIIEVEWAYSPITRLRQRA